MERPQESLESAEDLVKRIRTGADREAEARLVARYARGVRILLGRHTRAAAEAEDLFQETFVLAVSKLRAGELREPAKLAAFLASLARNLATEHYRKRARRQTDVDTEVATAAAAPEPGGQLRELLRGEEASLVRRVLEELSTARDREILFRFYIGEEDKEEIAADHGLTGLQLNRVLHRARERYRSLYLDRLEAHGGLAAGALADAVLLLLLAAGASVRLFGPLKG
jgi:RNA polymerase sigma-70 factor (ECF subfamily)